MIVKDEKGMRLLITGATGFLGSHLVDALLNEGHTVAVLKRSSSNTERIDGVLSRISTYDADKGELLRAFHDHEKIDAVIHTATCYGRGGESMIDIYDANVIFPLEILAIAINFGVGAFFNTDTVLPKYTDAYALSKKHFRDLGELAANEHKQRFVNIKLEHIYGPRDDKSKFPMYVIDSCLSNLPELRLSPGGQKRDFIYIDDVTSAYLHILRNTCYERAYYEEYHVGSGQAITIREFVETVHRLTDSKTVLKFGALPCRENELMESRADTRRLKALGWKSTTSVKQGIIRILRKLGVKP